MTAAKAPALRWVADATQVAHASTPRAPRTLCHELAVPVRFAWPALRRCTTCVALAEGLPIG